MVKQNGQRKSINRLLVVETVQEVAAKSEHTAVPFEVVELTMLQRRTTLSHIKGEKGVNLGWIWPRISDKASARKAVKDGFWACILIVALEAAIGAYAIVTHQEFGGYYDARVLVDGALFAIIAWRLWNNSRTWAVIGLILMGFEIVDKVQNKPGTFGVITA